MTIKDRQGFKQSNTQQAQSQDELFKKYMEQNPEEAKKYMQQQQGKAPKKNQNKNKGAER